MAYVESSSSVLFTSCTLSKNTATTYGGVAYVSGAYVSGAGASATFNSCNLAENTARVSYPLLLFSYF